MNNFATKIVGALLSLFLLFYVGYQIVSVVWQPYRTIEAHNYTYNDSINCEGVIIRQEEELTADFSGIACYLVADGGKLAKGDSYLSVYGSEEDIARRARLSRIEEEIALLERAQSVGGVQTTLPDTLEAQIRNQMQLLLQMGESANLSGLADSRDDLLLSMNRLQIATGMVEDFSEAVSALQKEADAIKKQLGSTLRTFSAPQPGYYSSVSDGLEKVLSKADISTLTPSSLKALMETDAAPSPRSSGRLIYSTDWYYAATFEEAHLERFAPGRKITLDFGFSSGKAITGTVQQISPVEDGKFLVVFQCSYMAQEPARMRTAKATVITASYEGLRIDKSALRIEDGQTGVFVILGNALRFRKVDILYENDEFFICSVGADSGSLKLYDEVVVEGKDLYDNKPIN
ncbi:MAG: hypothetical protein IJY82_06385 [Oscillospiraceae bacterium]|nr:hypothetical protein [Oscillospiraceae bacterium]